MTDNVGLNIRIVDSNFTVSQTYAATIDLVVIHSLGPFIDTSWLSNLLLHDISHINILEFNIEVSSFLSPEKLEQRALKFLRQLASYISLRDHHQEIVFIAHSLGGLLLTRALSIAFQSPQTSDLYRVAYLSRAVIFLGTPLHGSVQVLEACVRNFFHLYETFAIDQRFGTDLFQKRPPLRQLARYLQQVQRGFKNLHRKYTSNLRSVSFFEGSQEQDNSAVVVPRDLVISYEIPAIALQRNHQNLCHFSRPDPSYRLLLGELKKYITVPSLVQNPHNTPPGFSHPGIPVSLSSSAALLTVHKPLDNQRVHSAKRVSPFGRTSLFERWITDTQQSPILWLHGKPGSGKTTLMGDLAQHCRHIASKLPSLTVSYFFNNKETVKKSKDGFFQAVVEQLREQTVYSCSISDATSATDSDFALLEDQNQATQRLKTLLNYISERHKVFVVVDALDECDKTEAATIVHFLRSLSATKRGDIRICMSSRARILQMQDEPCHHIDRDNAPEIARFVKNQAAKFGNKQLCAGTISQFVIDEITRKASGMFLFARLSVQVLLNAYKRGENLLEVLQSLPDDLESMYAAILDRIRKDTTILARSALQIMMWVLFAVRPLTITELRDALLVSVEKPNSCNISDDNQLCPTSVGMREAPLQLFKDLESQCYGLVDLQGDTNSTSSFKIDIEKKSKVTFTHSTVRDYLDSNLELLRLDTHSANNVRGTLHLECAEVSLRYLSSRRDCHVIEDDESESSLLTAFPFINYAATCWIQHMIAAEHEQTEVNEFIEWLSRLFTTNPKHWLSSWLSVERACSPSKKNVFDSSCTFLHITSYFGLTRLTEAYLRYYSSAFGSQPEIDKCDNSGKTPLCFAAVAGRTQNVRLLLDAGANIALADHVNGQTALHRAAWAGHKDITMLLIEAGAKVGSVEDGTSILSECAAQGHDGVMKILLNNGADANFIDKQRGQSPLSLALSNRHKQVVSLLIQHGVDPNTKDVDTEVTPLHHAIMSKDPMMVWQLLEAGARVPRKPVASLPPGQGLWVDRVMQMVLAESQEMITPNRECPKTSDDSKSGATCPPPSTIVQDRAASRFSNKRSFSTYSKQNEEEERELPPNKRSSQFLPTDNIKDVIPFTLACPYFVHNKRRFRSRRCGQSGFVSIPRLKEHLRDNHRIHRCRICGVNFDTSDKLNQHSDQRLCDRESFRDYAEGYDEEQDRDIKNRLRNKPVEEKWQIIYKILFPQQNTMGEPSPYFEISFVNDFVHAQDDHFQSPEFQGQLEDIIVQGDAPNITAARITDLYRRSSGEIASRHGHSVNLAGSQSTDPQPETQLAGQMRSHDQPDTIGHQPGLFRINRYDVDLGEFGQNPVSYPEQIEEHHAPSLDSAYDSLHTAHTMRAGPTRAGYLEIYDQGQKSRDHTLSNSGILRDLQSEVSAPFPLMSTYQEDPNINPQLLHQRSSPSQLNVDVDELEQFRPLEAGSHLPAPPGFMGGQRYPHTAGHDEFDWPVPPDDPSS